MARGLRWVKAVAYLGLVEGFLERSGSVLTARIVAQITLVWFATAFSYKHWPRRRN